MLCYSMYPSASRSSFSEECILGATCTYLPESTRSGPCEGLLLSLSHQDESGLVGVWYWVNTAHNWLKWGSDYLLKGLSAFFTRGSWCIDRIVNFKICFLKGSDEPSCKEIPLEPNSPLMGLLLPLKWVWMFYLQRFVSFLSCCITPSLYSQWVF